MSDNRDPLNAHQRVKHRTIWLLWLVPVVLATTVATALLFAERSSGDAQAAIGMLAIAVLWLVAITTVTVTAAIASLGVWLTHRAARTQADAQTGSENDQQAEAIRRRSRRILGAALVTGALAGAALVIAVALASLLPYTPSEQKCGEVYGSGNSRIGINDADDCLGLSRELRDDGQFRSTKRHCDALTQDAALMDDRCKSRQARHEASYSVMVSAKHRSFRGPANGISYLEPKDRVAVWVQAEGSIPNPINNVTVLDTHGGSVTLRFRSEQDASRFNGWLAKGVRLLVPIEHREGQVPEFTQGSGGPFTEGHVGLGALIPDTEGRPMGRCARDLQRIPPVRSAGKKVKRSDLLRLCRKLDKRGKLDADGSLRNGTSISPEMLAQLGVGKSL